MKKRKATTMGESDQAGPDDAVNAVPPVRQLIPLALQHVIISYSGIITTPLLIGLGIGLTTDEIGTLVAANVMVAGAATLLQTLGIWKVGVRYPIVMGSTFTAIGPAIIIGEGHGLSAVFGGSIVAGVVTFFVAPFFGKLLRFFPPVVTGSVIAIIGFSLLPTTSHLIAGNDGDPSQGEPIRYFLAALTIALVLFVDRLGRNNLRRMSILVALILGTLVAWALGETNFSAVADADPVGFVDPLAFGPPTFVLAAIVPMLVVQLVNFVESTGDTLAIGQIIGKETGPKQITRALRADGLATAIGGFFNSFTLVTFGNSVGLVSITQVFSRFVVALAGAIMVLMGLLPQLGAIAASLPAPVLGGISVVMFGTVGAVGVRIMAQSDLTSSRNIFIVAVAFGFGLMPVGAPDFYASFPEVTQPVLTSGIAAGGIAAFVLNLLLNETTRRGSSKTSESAVGLAEVGGPEVIPAPETRSQRSHKDLEE